MTKTAEISAVRLALWENPEQRHTSDGAWWPRSKSLQVEVPTLLAELDRRSMPIVRVSYNPSFWLPAPARVAAGPRWIQLSWLRSIDPGFLCLFGRAPGERLVLRVISPSSTPEEAAECLAGSL